MADEQAASPNVYEITATSVTFPTTTTVKDDKGNSKAAPVERLSYSAPHMVKGPAVSGQGPEPQFVGVPQTPGHQMTMHLGHWLRAEGDAAVALCEELVKKGYAKLKD